MQTTPRSSLARPVQQARAQRTSDAIMQAGRELLRERDFADVTVAEIARTAGVSVGGFYARFEGKEALLYVLFGEVMADCATTLERALSPRRMTGASIEVVIRAVLRAWR